MDLEKIFNAGLSYQDYRELINNLIAADKTTGNDQSSDLVNYTKLNVQRMNRIDKTVFLSPQEVEEAGQHDKDFRWLLIGDAWCGDCAQIIPVIHKVVEATKGKVQLRIVSRDTFPELIEEFTTNGSKSTPKLIVLDGNAYNAVLTTWGSRPEPAHQIMLDWKAHQNTITWDDFEKNLHLWYTKDKGATTIKELLQVLKIAQKEQAGINENLPMQ
ncbi:thioredoxin family protein [Elizabethkingia anophelis]|uniref:Thioredoxin family protein n=2 Tax=Elizabethkingia TaxID=308865 RepID=A0ABD5B9K7_ELIMR|nr:thioredoxin family protein [Elizabethkingia miricola]MBS1740483.1 thioredoxin family protein [Bacteroidota bacterium]MDQ8750063.1 thioredoxin family protein [Elizabethkingia miricola]MDV3616164.1 thioredoxin family protein [Elizabethkingia anophelis]MDV3663237.1 thioredoxin family protein [Elizabethkingia anophelis]